MDELTFTTRDGTPVPAVTAAQMREVDRIAVEEFGVSLRQSAGEHKPRSLKKL